MLHGGDLDDIRVPTVAASDAEAKVTAAAARFFVERVERLVVEDEKLAMGELGETWHRGCCLPARSVADEQFVDADGVDSG
jgi:hypothetical protein